MSKSRFEVNSHRESGITAEYVIAHAARQARRGKNPSTGFMGITNPREALRVAKGHVESAKLENPEDVLGLKDGSILGWVKAQRPKNNVQFTAVSLLSGSSLSVRTSFIAEDVAWHERLPEVIPDGETALSVVASNMNYITSSYTLGNRGPWAEAIDAVANPPEPSQPQVA